MSYLRSPFFSGFFLRFFSICFFSTCLFLFSPLFISVAHSHPEGDLVADIAERYDEIVVNITTILASDSEDAPFPFPDFPENSPFHKFFKDFFEKEFRTPRDRPLSGLGSGFIIDSEGLILTNHHVIDGAGEIFVKLSDGRRFPARFISGDAASDLALLRIDVGESLPFAVFGDSDRARIGEWVVAIGNPFGLSGSLTTGVISALNRDIHAGPYDDFIQTDASINKGHSGSPLVNMRGEVIGINTAIITPTNGSVGLSFAIPSNSALHIVNQLREYGEIRRGWLGVRIQSVSDAIAESLGLESVEGALVADVLPDSPASLSGVIAGDLITHFDGRKIIDMRDLPRIVSVTEVGKEVEVIVFRRGEEVRLRIEIGLLEEDRLRISSSAEEEGEWRSEEGSAAEPSVLGMELRSLTALLRKNYDISDDVSGVIIISVSSSSDAFRKGLEEGDVIVEVGQRGVSSAREFSDIIESHKELGRGSVLLLISNRVGDVRFVPLRLNDLE